MLLILDVPLSRCLISNTFPDNLLGNKNNQPEFSFLIIFDSHVE